MAITLRESAPAAGGVEQAMGLLVEAASASPSRLTVSQVAGMVLGGRQAAGPVGRAAAALREALEASPQEFTEGEVYGAFQLASVLQERGHFTMTGGVRFDEAAARRKYEKLRDMAILAKSNPAEAKRAHRAIAAEIKHQVFVLGHEVKGRNRWLDHAPIAVAAAAAGLSVATLGLAGLAIGGILGGAVAANVGAAVVPGVAGALANRHMQRQTGRSEVEGWKAQMGEHKAELSPAARDIKDYIERLVALQKTVPAPHPYD